MTSNIFKYESLTEKDSFRLILLQPSQSHEADLHGDLLHTTLSQCDREIIDHYTALSYVWGDASKRGRIIINGKHADITATLEAALRALRDPTRVIRVWADALAIDQSNLDERAFQVGLMGRIYATAHHTVIYLGPLTKHSEKVLSIAPSNTTGVVGNQVSWLDAEKAGDEILKTNWFSRVWIFQELVLSSDVWVQTGNLRARWTDLCSILLSPNAQTIQGESAIRRKVLQDMNSSRQSSQTNIFNLLLSRRGLGATDPRDMIYAHIGLASDRSDLERYVKVDYRLSVEAIYEDTARYLYDTSGPENLFPHLDNKDLSTRRENLASWAPDWSISSPRLDGMYRDNLISTHHLKSRNHHVFISNPPILTHVGYQVDVVEDVSLTLPPPSELNPKGRDGYQQAVNELQILYRKAGGVWWSGDSNGRYRHIRLAGVEEKHNELCLRLVQEWIDIMTRDLPSLSSLASTNELESHQRFIDWFAKWLKERAVQQIIMVGGDSDHLESIMYRYLFSDSGSSLLTGRRFITTKSGRVGVAPKHAKKGDIIVYLAGTLIPLVLRTKGRHDVHGLEESIKKAFRTKKDDNNEANNSPLPQLFEFDEMPIEVGAVIGECYVEGEIGWMLEPKNQPQYTIFALR